MDNENDSNLPPKSSSDPQIPSPTPPVRQTNNTGGAASYSRGQDEAIVRTGADRRPSRFDQAKEYLSWKLKDVFDWNGAYLKQLRGILVAIEVTSSMLAMALISTACQMLPFGLGRDEESHGFFCQSAETFLFVIACSSFISSLLMLLCCLLSKKTAVRLAKTSFELSFYMLYFIFFLMSCLILITKVSNRDFTKLPSKGYYNLSLAAGVFGNIACIAYGISIAWYFVTFKDCVHEV